jgi:Ring finger domain
MSQNRNSRNFSLTRDQRVLLDLYTNFYNNTNRQIDSLHELQNDINQIIGLNTVIHPSNYRNASSANATNNHQNSNFNTNSRHTFRHNNTRNNEHRYAHNRHHNNLESAFSTRRVIIEGVPYLIEIPSSHNENAIRSGSTYNNPSPEYTRIISNLLRSFYSRNIVAPTREQINNSTRILHFSDIENPLNNSCPVTLDRFDGDSSVTQIIHCRHIFTPDGIDSWLQSNVICPVCRYDIREYVPTRSNTPAQTAPIASESVEESKDETTREDSKSDSENTNQERNSIPTNPLFAESNNNIAGPSRLPPLSLLPAPNIDNQNVLTGITENILGQILNAESINLDPLQNSIFYDASNNQFVFEGFIRRQ